MKNLELIIEKAKKDFEKIGDEAWCHKRNPQKWSRKEILGHLVDSAINNLQRFTEVAFVPKPYILKKYNQDELVKANGYQNVPVEAIINLWSALNCQIWKVMQNQNMESLSFQVEVEAGNIQSLEWLMDDYIVHLEYHLNQIKI